MSDSVTIEELKRIVRDLGKAQQETERVQQETKKAQQKTQRAQQETEVALQKLSKSLDKASGNFNNKWGQFMENLVKGDLVGLLKERGIEVVRVQPRVIYLYENGDRKGEIDLLAINGEEVVAVEVKTRLIRKNVDHFVTRKLVNLKSFLPEYRDKKVYGAVAYLDTADGSGEYAAERGLFVIEAGGGRPNLSAIVNERNFEPKVF